MRKCTACAGALLALAASPALAGRPFTTEDAGVLAAGECELETFVLQQTARDAPRASGGWIQPGCGVGVRTQLAVGAGRTEADAERVASAALIGKTWLREPGEDRTGLTLAYSIGGEKAPGESFKHESTALAAVVSSPVAKDLVIHANLGWTRSQAERKDTATWALAVERTGDRGLDVGAEVYGDDREAPWLGVGARYALRPDRLFVDFSWAMQMAHARSKLLTIGLKLAFRRPRIRRETGFKHGAGPALRSCPAWLTGRGGARGMGGVLDQGSAQAAVHGHGLQAKAVTAFQADVHIVGAGANRHVRAVQRPLHTACFAAALGEGFEHPLLPTGDTGQFDVDLIALFVHAHQHRPLREFRCSLFNASQVNQMTAGEERLKT